MSKVATADMENVRMIFESLDCLVRILYRCDIYEKLYTGRGLQATKQLNSTLVNLYVAVLEYLCYARRDISKNTTGNLGQGEQLEYQRLIIHLVRILGSLFSDTGQLFMKIRECEIDVQNDADTAEKEGRMDPRNLPRLVLIG